MEESPALVLRGPYIVAAGLESRQIAQSRSVDSPLVDARSTVDSPIPVGPGVRGLLVDLDRYPKDYVGVVAAACRVTNDKVTDQSITFDTIGQADTKAVVSLLMAQVPRNVSIDGEPAEMDYQDGVLRLRFANRARNVRISISR